MQQTIDFIKNQIGDFNPEVGIILGSGLGDFADAFESVKIPYEQIPGFEKSAVQGHAGQLVFAKIQGKNVVMMQGRYHFYEGYSMQTIVFPIKVMKFLGINTLIITNAAGAVNKKFKPADLMVITDHMNFMGTNPLIGKNDETLGTRFPDMSNVYKNELIQLAESCAKSIKLKLQKGVYAAFSGPSYETPAEIKMLSRLGADAVGMSTAPEAIFANYCSIKVLGISCITNCAAGVGKKLLSHEEVIETADIAKSKFKKLIQKILEKI